MNFMLYIPYKRHDLWIFDDNTLKFDRIFRKSVRKAIAHAVPN